MEQAEIGNDGKVCSQKQAAWLVFLFHAAVFHAAAIFHDAANVAANASHVSNATSSTCATSSTWTAARRWQRGIEKGRRGIEKGATTEITACRLLGQLAYKKIGGPRQRRRLPERVVEIESKTNIKSCSQSVETNRTRSSERCRIAQTKKQERAKETAKMMTVEGKDKGRS